MKEENKVFIKAFFMYGLPYAGLMAWWRNSKEQNFDIWIFLFHFFVFGIVMALMTRYFHKKQMKKDSDAKEQKKTSE